MSANRRIHEVMAERMRERIWADVAPPPEMLQRSLNTLANKLNAKKKTYITFQGVVTKVIEDDDHDVQLKAIDQIAKIAGAHIRERDEKPTQPRITMRYDPVTGISEIIIGDPDTHDDQAALPPAPSSGVAEVQPSLDFGTHKYELLGDDDTPLRGTNPDDEVSHYKIPRETDREFRKRLFNEIRDMEEDMQ